MKSRSLRASFRWLIAAGFALIALYPAASTQVARRAQAERLSQLQRKLQHSTRDPVVVLRLARLSPLLASWETIGGCGAGGTGGVGPVKWIGRNTTGGLFQNITQANYIPFADGYNVTLSNLITREIDDRWSVAVQVPFVHKRYNNYLHLPLD